MPWDGAWVMGGRVTCLGHGRSSHVLGSRRKCEFELTRALAVGLVSWKCQVPASVECGSQMYFHGHIEHRFLRSLSGMETDGKPLNDTESCSMAHSKALIELQNSLQQCVNTMMIQRALASKSLSHAKGATIFAAYIKILPFFMIILPGMISRALYPDDVACVLPEECMRACGSLTSCSNSAYPRLVVGIMPAGLKGLMMAVMLSALMSDLTSIFNSAATMFKLDIWSRMRPAAETRELLLVGKLFVVARVPIIELVQGGQLFLYIQKIGAYLSPPIACVYTMAVLWPRMNEKGAFWGLMTGLAVGLVRMALGFSYPPPKCWEQDARPAIIKFNFMYFAMILFWITGITGAVVSLLTKPREDCLLTRTTYKTRFDI
ncbi:sodium/glucose cotransporter 4-like [Penaeus japonicus]|uniref:sodium/glucose cotransporter 4-like n=1 Tax=Penaeus japonicus TaxID=27405 RepID=UPI001C71392A|nr:sodium/glucose cotransporter 4-like [Penaeus japonicus]